MVKTATYSGYFLAQTCDKIWFIYVVTQNSHPNDLPADHISPVTCFLFVENVVDRFHEIMYFYDLIHFKTTNIIDMNSNPF